MILAVVPPATGFLIPLSILFYIQCRPDEARSPLFGAVNNYGAFAEGETIVSTSSDFFCTASDNSSFIQSRDERMLRAFRGESENIQSTDYESAPINDVDSSSYDSASDDYSS